LVAAVHQSIASVPHMAANRTWQSTAAEPLMWARGLRKSFARGLARTANRTLAIHDLDLELFPFELLAIVGPEGSGKTTLLQCVAGLLRPDSGVVSWFGELFPGGGCVPRTAYVAAVTVYYPFLTARDVLQYRVAREAIPSRRQEKLIARALDRVGLAGKSAARVMSLRRDELKCLAVAEALVMEPAAVLVDAGVADTADSCPDSVSEVLREEVRCGASVIVATRDVANAGAVATRLLFLDRGRKVGSFVPHASPGAAATPGCLNLPSTSLFVAERVH